MHRSKLHPYMNCFSPDKMTGTHEDRRYWHCDTQPKLVCKMLDSRSGKTIRMFERRCGERSWDQYARCFSWRHKNRPQRGLEAGADA
jgi:hypothetical protein